MQAIPAPTTRTFTELARRKQIVQAAIETIAEHGYPQSSFARIAECAGLKSTGLISYHFSGKQDLNAEIVAFVLDDLGQWMHQRLEAIRDPNDALVAYIRALIGYMKQRGDHLIALADLMLHGAFEWKTEDQQAATSGLEEILQRGQQNGQFRSFDVTVMATTIQRSLDGIPFLQRATPALDLDAYANELTELFQRATAADSGGIGQGTNQR